MKLKKKHKETGTSHKENYFVKRLLAEGKNQRDEVTNRYTDLHYQLITDLLIDSKGAER